ncbi:MAG: hypothetical protein ACE5KM_24060 [Planctomycetaceae bacterium]
MTSANVDTELLIPAEQDELLEMLARGGSALLACRQIGRPIAAFFLTVERDDGFRRRLESVHVCLSQNVASALYKAAMEGSVSAQTFYLRNNPPPEWTGKEDEVSRDEFDDLTTDELARLAEAFGVAPPPEIAPLLEPPRGGDAPDGVPPGPSADE